MASDMNVAKVNMCRLFCYVTIISILFLQCNTLNCRSDGEPKEEDLKAVYMTCLKKQESKNSSDMRGFQDDQDRKELRGRFNQRTQWNTNLRGRDDGMGDRDDKMGNRGDRVSVRDDRMNNRDRVGNRNDRRSSVERMGGRDDDRAFGRDSMIGGSTKNDEQMYHMRDRNNGYGEDQFGDRYNYPHNDDFDSGLSQHQGYHSTTQSSRRYKRSKRTQSNSGQRSQYNPNTNGPSGSEETYGEGNKNSTNSSKVMDNKACALHCFMEQLEMIGDNDMPDRYLVTHALTKDVKNEDLRDFLQESIDECFQILDNENTEDKCIFSKNFMMCLSEKGRANCDDWKDDLQF